MFLAGISDLNICIYRNNPNSFLLENNDMEHQKRNSLIIVNIKYLI